jgi:hypothetical protein
MDPAFARTLSWMLNLTWKQGSLQTVYQTSAVNACAVEIVAREAAWLAMAMLPTSVSACHAALNIDGIQVVSGSGSTGRSSLRFTGGAGAVGGRAVFVGRGGRLVKTPIGHGEGTARSQG